MNTATNMICQNTGDTGTYTQLAVRFAAPQPSPTGDLYHGVMGIASEAHEIQVALAHYHWAAGLTSNGNIENLVLLEVDSLRSVSTTLQVQTTLTKKPESQVVAYCQGELLKLVLCDSLDPVDLSVGDLSYTWFLTNAAHASCFEECLQNLKSEPRLFIAELLGEMGDLLWFSALYYNAASVLGMTQTSLEAELLKPPFEFDPKANAAEDLFYRVLCASENLLADAKSFIFYNKVNDKYAKHTPQNVITLIDYVKHLAKDLNVDLQKLLDDNIFKLSKRYPEKRFTIVDRLAEDKANEISHM